MELPSRHPARIAALLKGDVTGPRHDLRRWYGKQALAWVLCRALLLQPTSHPNTASAHLKPSDAPSVLQEDAAERERVEQEQRQKLKQKARNKEHTAKERAAAERKASERETCSRQEADAKQREVEAAVEMWGCLLGWEYRHAHAWCKALAQQ